MEHTSTHKLSGILIEVFTPFLIQKKSTNSSYLVLLQVFVYKYYKDLESYW